MDWGLLSIWSFTCCESFAYAGFPASNVSHRYAYNESQYMSGHSPIQEQHQYFSFASNNVIKIIGDPAVVAVD